MASAKLKVGQNEIEIVDDPYIGESRYFFDDIAITHLLADDVLFVSGQGPKVTLCER